MGFKFKHLFNFKSVFKHIGGFFNKAKGFLKPVGDIVLKYFGIDLGNFNDIKDILLKLKDGGIDYIRGILTKEYEDKAFKKIEVAVVDIFEAIDKICYKIKIPQLQLYCIVIFDRLQKIIESNMDKIEVRVHEMVKDNKITDSELDENIAGIIKEFSDDIEKFIADISKEIGSTQLIDIFKGSLELPDVVEEEEKKEAELIISKLNNNVYLEKLREKHNM